MRERYQVRIWDVFPSIVWTRHHQKSNRPESVQHPWECMTFDERELFRGDETVLVLYHTRIRKEKMMMKVNVQNSIHTVV